MALTWEISIYMYLVELLYHISCLTEMCEKNDLGEIRIFVTSRNFHLYFNIKCIDRQMHKYYTKVKCLRWNCKNIHPQIKKNNLLPSTGVDSKVSVEHHEFSVHVLELYKKY